MSNHTAQPLRIAAAIIAIFFEAVPPVNSHGSTASSTSLILFAGNQHIQTGPYSAFARFQNKLGEVLKACQRDAAARQLSRETTGIWSATTSQVISNASRCKSLKSAAPTGALTAALWHEVMGDEAPPDLQEKTTALSLTFEATGFDQKPEWNFCQDSLDPLAVARPGHGATQTCYNQTDPCSFVTWGPRGATAGQGREIQWVLANVMRRAPGVVEYAFGPEREHVQRFTQLDGPPPESCDGSTPLEHFMCAVWIDPNRRQIWEDALQNLGKQSVVRTVFEDVYAREEFDGYKMTAYYKLWQAMGLAASEIDYAFFYDRSTHIGGPPDTITPENLKQCLDAEPARVTRNAAARRCLSHLHPHPTQPQDRAARDTAFYLDSYSMQGLTASEVRTWQRHIPLAAGANFGLSDEVPAGRADAASSSKLDILPPTDGFTEMTEAERACPAGILQPVRTQPPSAKQGGARQAN